MSPDRTPELSVVLPCLNEAGTLAACIRTIRETLESHAIHGETIVADNGSTDGSSAIAEREGARVTRVPVRGYGRALRGGIAASHGVFVIMGDADGSYDFRDIPRFLEKLRDGNDLVMGNRFAGEIRPGAMSWINRTIGNPLLSGLGRLLLGWPVGDAHCGLRGFRRDAYERMQLKTNGMEFASEMVAKATLLHLRIAEIPITLSRDGRSRRSHLRPLRDGLRHLTFLTVFFLRRSQRRAAASETP